MSEWAPWIAFCENDRDIIETKAEGPHDLPDVCQTCGGVLVVYKLVDRPSTYDGVVE